MLSGASAVGTRRYFRGDGGSAPRFLRNQTFASALSRAANMQRWARTGCPGVSQGRGLLRQLPRDDLRMLRRGSGHVHVLRFKPQNGHAFHFEGSRRTLA